MQATCLHNCLVRPVLREGAHVFEVPARQALGFRKRSAQVGGEAIDHLGAPTGLLLARQDVAADAPVQEHELAVHGERGLHARGAPIRCFRSSSSSP